MRGRGISPSIKTMKPNEKERILFMLFVVRSPENSLLCVFGQVNPSPTTDDGIGPV